MRLRLCLSDPASFAFLAEQYRAQAVMCRQMALATVNPFKEGCLEFAIREHTGAVFSSPGPQCTNCDSVVVYQ